MEREFPFVKITPALAEVVGNPDEGTRIFRAYGDDKAYRKYLEVLFGEFPRGLVSPGGASRYAGVSRAAVHKRMKDGKLTAFIYNFTQRSRSYFLGRPKDKQELASVYVPVSECRAWWQELCMRAKRLAEEREAKGEPLDDKVIKEISDSLHAEAAGMPADWDGWFLYPPLSWQHKRGKKG